MACRLLGENARLRRRIRRERPQSWPARAIGRFRPADRAAQPTGLAARIASSRAAPGPTAAWQCLAIVDLDFFKQVNAIHGHATGDRVLADAGRALRDALRTGDMVARLGGDEFGLLFEIVTSMRPRRSSSACGHA